jgi:hypothetical protein
MMRNISRRNLLNGLASVPFLAALSPLDASPSAIEASSMRGDVNCGDELRIVLHGAFAVILEDSGVRLYAPTVRDHSYKAGCWGQELRLEEGSSYPFTPVSELCPSKLPPIDSTTNAVLYRKTAEQSIQDICFCSLSGPLPNEIHSLRRVYKVHPDDAFFDGSDAKDINANLKTFSLVHVLVYKFKTGPTFADLPNIPWKQTYREMFVDESLKAKSSAVRMELPKTFHFFAEPDTNVRQQKAFPAIVEHFSDVYLSVTETEPSHKSDWSTSLKGFHRWEQHGLLERSKLLQHSDCRSMEPLGHMPANCGKLFVDNRTSTP